MEESLDSSTSIAHIIESGSEEEIRMILGGREGIRHAGIIRAGKQRPLAKCTKEEVALFEKLEAEGMSYDDINRAMGGTPKSKESKLTTTNTDYFVLRESDFKKPSDCAYIMSHYADPDGKVRRLPIFLTVSDIDKAIPHGFTAFDGKGNIRCKSFYDGDDLKFRYLEKSVAVSKPSDWKILDSDDEDEATKACGYKVTFSGMYRVNVVGLRGIGEIIIPNRSWYGMGDAVAVLNKIKKRLGRIDGLLNGEPFLELCKVQEFVKHEGKKVKQSIITLELSVDPMEIERYAEKTLTRGARALALFNGTKPERTPEPAKTAESAKEPEATKEPEKEPAQETPDPAIENALKMLATLAEQYGLTADDLAAYGKAKLKHKLDAEKSLGRLRQLYADLRKELLADKAGVKTYCESLSAPDPEIDGMLAEYGKLADAHGLEYDHLMAFLVAVTGGVMPGDQSLEELQQTYREITARLERGELEQFKAEIAGDFEEQKAAQRHKAVLLSAAK